MRTLIAALAFALAIPAAATPADACGGYGGSVDQSQIEPRVVIGTLTAIHRADNGRIQAFISYPTVDGEFSGLYVGIYELEENATSRRLLRQWRRAERRSVRPWEEIVLTRAGEANEFQVTARTAKRA